MSENSSVILFERASQMLAEADTIQKAKELKDLALTAAEWARRKGMGERAVQYARSYALDAMRRLGELLNDTPTNPGTKSSFRGKDSSGGHIVLPPENNVPTIAELGITKRESADARVLAQIKETAYEDIKANKKTINKTLREIRKEKVISELEDISKKEVKKNEGVYDVIVIDPPWPMEKIERDVRPNQVAFDYPTMSISEIWNIEIPNAKNCHIWIWTTHKYLPELFKMIHFRRWKYICTFIWHKPGGFQPVGLPQYNAEFAIYCRLGHPVFKDTKAFPVCFNGKRGAHSEKPEEFYDMIRRVTAGRRLDMFGRRKIEGFDSWGNQANG